MDSSGPAGTERLFGRSPVLEGVFDRRSIVRHDIQKITGRHQGDSTQKRYKVSIMFHGRFLLKIQIQAKIENPLKRISETVSGHFRVPHLKVGQDEQVGRIEIDPRLIHLHLSGPLHRQRIADFEFFEPQERSVPKPPGTVHRIIGHYVVSQSRP